MTRRASSRLFRRVRKRSKVRVTESAGGVVVGPKGLVLVVNQNRNSWSLPKGHLDAGEGPLAAARREIYEESGVKKLRLVKRLGTYERPRIGKRGGNDLAQIKRLTFYLFTTRQSLLKPLDPRNPEARWVERSKVAAMLTHAKDKEFFLNILNQLPKKETA